MEVQAHSGAFLQPTPDTAAAIESILGITNKGTPGDGWSGIKLTVASNEFATVQVEFLVSVDQILEIAQLMRRVPVSMTDL